MSAMGSLFSAKKPAESYILLIMLFFFSNAAWTLEVGVAAREITPDVKEYRVPMAGYGARGGNPSQGVHDPLKAKALVFRDGSKQMALITTDLRSITPQFKAQIVQKASSLGFRKDNVFVCASHTHAGPSMYPEPFWQIQFGKFDPAIVQSMSDQVAAALREAAENATAANVGFGSMAVEGFTANRRWEVDNESRIASGEKPQTDPFLRLLRVDDTTGAMKALVVLFATHPTIGGADNFLLSAEWPGVLQRTIETMCEGTIALFCNGAVGDQRPIGASGEDAFERIEDFGGRLAAKAVHLASTVQTLPDQRISYAHDHPPLPPITYSPKALKGPFAFLAELGKEQLPKRAELQLLAIGDVVLAGLPGEPLCAVGQAVCDSLQNIGFGNVLVIGLANDYVGYIVTEEEYAHGGYEVDHRSFYGPELGDFMVRETAKLAHRIAPTRP